MPKPPDRVQLIKQEDSSRGGAEDDFDAFLNGPLNPDEDAPEVGGIFFQSSGVRDNTVTIYREAGEMWFEDALHSGVSNRVNLDDLLTSVGSGISDSSHKRLRHGIHFIDNGPAEGFVSGAEQVTTYNGVFVASETWYESSTHTEKIVELNIDYSGFLSVQEEWKIYDEDGSSVLATITDHITYNGVFETLRVRTII